MYIVDAEGNETTISVDGAAEAALTGAGAGLEFYTIDTINDSGVVTKVTKVTRTDLTSIGNDRVNNGSAYDYNEDTVIVFIDLDEDVTTPNDVTYNNASRVDDPTGMIDLTNDLDKNNHNIAKLYDNVECAVVDTGDVADFIYVVRNFNVQ